MKKTLITSLLAVVCVVLSGGFAAGVTVTNATLDTENDLLDIGGGTKFAFDANGDTFNYGNSPWFPQAPAMYDNDTNSQSVAVINGEAVAPALFGVRDLDAAYELGSFAINTGTASDWEMDYSFTIQGSNDTTDGQDGTWTDIFSFTGEDLLKNKTYCWNSKDDTFLISAAFTAFRLGESNPNCPYVEIEFFAVPPPEATVIMIK